MDQNPERSALALRPIEFWGAYTSRTLRPLWVAEELGLAYQLHPIAPRSGETQTDAFTRLNPKQKIPCMVDGNVPGTLVLTESLPIGRYLIAAYGTKALSAPTLPLQAAREDEWCCYALAELDETSLYVIRRHRDLAHIYGEGPEVVKACFEYLDRHLKVVNAALEMGGFILGDRFSLADIMLTSCLAWAKDYGATLRPASEAYLQRMAGRSAYQRALAANTPAQP